MSATRDRRGREERGSRGLLERDQPLRAIAQLIADTRRGQGAALLVEGHAGLGKTRLHEAALDLGRGAGLQVLWAAGAELERNLAHGVARQLLGRLLSELDAPQRESMLAQAPARLRLLAGLEVPESRALEVDDEAISQGMFTLIAQRSEPEGALLAIDDLHWCDNASLELVLYLLHRVTELPLAIVLTRRHSGDQEAPDVLERIATHPAVRLEVLAPLQPDSVAAVVRGALGNKADQDVVDACFDATSGNPFYLRELLLALRDTSIDGSEQLVRRARSLAPDAVTRSLRVRVGRLGAEAGKLARAVAVLGDEVPLRQAAALADMAPRAAAAAADDLGAVEVLLAREPLQYVHPLVRRAILLDIPPGQRATSHLDAARLLYAEGESAERVAAHLLLGRPEGSDWVVRRLSAAAHEAQIRGAARSAIDYLLRALEEPPGPALRAEVLAELGAAEAAVGSEAAVVHLAAAVDAAPEPLRRAQLALIQGNALYTLGLYPSAAAAFDRGREELQRSAPDAGALGLQDELEIGYFAAGAMVPELRRRAVAHSAELVAAAEAEPGAAGHRALLAQAALHQAFDAQPVARVERLAERAWDGGALLREDGAEGLPWTLIVQAHTLAGNLERALELCDVAMERASSPLALTTVSYSRALPLLWQGRVSDATAALHKALKETRSGRQRFSRSVRATMLLCLLEHGDLAGAEEQLLSMGDIDELRDLEDAYCLAARAQLRLVQGRPQEGLGDALRTAEAIGDAIKTLAYCQWRTTAALAALAVDERDRALALAEEAVRLYDTTGVLHQRIRARWVLGLCHGGEEGLRLLQEAAEVGRAGPPRLETVRALVELGSALRRANRRSDAREPLQRAADMALAGGANALHERAHAELAAAGSRPRRQWLTRGPESLTPSERRIAELAARGQSNREIAQTLFVTPKTVEYHLRNTYRKLEIEGRGALPAALAD